MFGVYLMFAMGLACAVFYWRAAWMEKSSPIVWAGLSVAIWAGTWIGLSWGLLGCVLAQVGLFSGITLWRTLKFLRRKDREDGGN
jgi:hypothetical protein